MNKEAFEKLPDEKKKTIQSAYFTALRKEISPAQFFAVCKEVLTDEQFKYLFSKQDSQPQVQAQIQPPQQQYQQQQQHSQPSQKYQQGQPQKEQEEIKTENLQDIMQYAGVDLKEEADQIVKETETHIQYDNYDNEDTNNQMHYLLNVQLFKEFIYRISRSRGVAVSEETYHLLFLILKRKLTDFVEKIDEASKRRVEYNLSEYIIKINNDLSRQLWCLEQIEKMEMEKLVIKKGDDDGKKKVKKANIQEREDLVIKKRLSNTVALAALGIQQKSWMNAEDSRVNDESTVFNSIYSPFDEKALDKKVIHRTITMKDFLYVLERDKRYSKSIFTIQHYFK